MPPNFWLFQSNPKVYDLAEDLKNYRVGDEDRWDVTQYRDEMKPGDKVILWVAGTRGGVYALGELTSVPYAETGDDGKDYWAVSFRYTDILDQPISRDTVKKHPILRNMQVLKIAIGTNKRVTEEEWNALQVLIAHNNGDTRPRIWKISAGEGGKYWKEFREKEMIGIEYDEYFPDDLAQFDSKEDLAAAILKEQGQEPKYNIDQLWIIRQEMREDDIVVAYGGATIKSWGRITTPYQYNRDAAFPYPHRRSVTWETVKDVPTSKLSNALQRKLRRRETIIELTWDEYQEIIGNRTSVNISNALSVYYASRGYRFPPELLATFVTALQTKGFVILSGLSGTGKTKLAQMLAALLPHPEETETIEETTEEGDIYIQVQPYMVKYARIIIPKSAWRLIDVPPAGDRVEIVVSLDGKSQKCWLVHASYTGDYLQLLLKGAVRKKFAEIFNPQDTLILQPQTGDDDEFAGFAMAKPGPAAAGQRRSLLNHIFVSVRPDWRDSKNLLGYYNPLTGIYDDTPFLRFLLQAKANYDQAKTEALPHFVILDEMNLARVEYYFADFLSILESGRIEENGYTSEKILLHGRDPQETLDMRGRPIPNSIPLPPNLYLIGTVNMDETTHAFSPKVLDRAFTIEFNEVDFRDYPAEDEITAVEAEKDKLQQVLLAGFRREGQFARVDKEDILAFVRTNSDYRDHLQVLTAHLSGYDLHFGYRVFDEIMQFMAIAEPGDLFDDLGTAFDVAVLMKVLPKFNGPRSRLRQPLEAVVAWAQDPISPESTDVSNKVKDADICRQFLNELPEGFAYPETARKAIRMLIRLHETGFASFA